MLPTALLCCALLAGARGEGTKKDVGDDLPKTNNVRFKGHTAEEWGPGLFDRDERTADAAAVALQRIGAEGLRYFLKGLRDDDVCFRALVHLPHKATGKYEKVFLPEIVRLLKSDNKFVRNAAGAALVNCGLKAGLPALREAHRREKDAQIKNYLGQHVAALEKK
jgi:hypothetical protein